MSVPAERNDSRVPWVLLIAAAVWVPLAPAEPAPVTRAGGGSVEARIERIERLLESQGLFDLVNQLDQLQREVQRLQGQLEQQSYELEQLRGRQRELYVDVDRRLQGVEQGETPGAGVEQPLALAPGAADPPLQALTPVTEPGAIGPQAPPLSVELASPSTAAPAPVPQASAAPAPVPQAAATPAPAPITAPVRPPIAAAAPPASGQVMALPGGTANAGAAEAAYNQAFSLLKAGRYDEAIAAFNGYLVEYPNSEYADNAQYWLGEAYYVTRQFEPAIAEYRKLIQAFPQSTKVAHAQLKIGYAYHELGQIEAAKAQLEQLAAASPGTTTARLAEKRLQDIRLQQPR
jgi:tol-pal system protein YbgF